MNPEKKVICSKCGEVISLGYTHICDDSRTIQHQLNRARDYIMTHGKTGEKVFYKRMLNKRNKKKRVA